MSRTVAMNTTSYTSYTMDMTPLCFAPFSLTDAVYNPSCYTQMVLDTLGYWLSIYARLNRIATQHLFGLIAQYSLPLLYTATICSILFGLVKLMLLDDTPRPLTLLESEIAQSIYSKASTGCTARMIHEHLYGFYENRLLTIDEVTNALHTLKERGMILPVQSTLWITTGK